MTEPKLDPRIIRTKEAIQTVFKQMVCELPYEKITVKAITEAARINRNTFYLHYNCVDDVLAEIQENGMKVFRNKSLLSYKPFVLFRNSII